MQVTIAEIGSHTVLPGFWEPTAVSRWPCLWFLDSYFNDKDTYSL